MAQVVLAVGETSPPRCLSPFLRPKAWRDRGDGASPLFRDRRPCRRRRGIAVLMVLLILSLTLALSYAAMRSQSTVVRIQRNSQRQSSARQAAVTGLTMALKKMSNGNWAGVGTTLNGSLSAGETFKVTYAIGDPALTPASPDYADLPYRVTLVSIGSAVDSQNPQCVSTYRIRAVFRLNPRKLPPQPADWSTMQQYTVYQSKKDTFQVDIPCRIEGWVRAQDKLQVALNYPNDYDAWTRYLNDLNRMRSNGLADYRPFSGRVYFPFSRQDWKYYNGLGTLLGVTLVDTAAAEAGADWAMPSSLTSYRIFAGGPVYTIPAVTGATMQDTTLGPDPATNPLGIYCCDQAVLSIQQNVSVRGSLFCRGSILVLGANVRFDPIDLPALHGSATPVRLPVVACNNFTLKPTAGAALNGLLAVFGEFKIERSSETVAFPVVGRVIAQRFTIQERLPWNTLRWNDLYFDFCWQLARPNPVSYFPVWLGNQGRSPQPRLTFKADPTAVAYSWYNSYYPIFVPDPNDAGLRWDLCEWTENP